MRLAPLALAACAAATTLAQDAGQKYRQGHSLHGEAFDTGPRTKPWRMTGIGHSHFPITAKHVELQEWFDQGNALLHSFWHYEAERAFRWCIKLEPDNPMPYWGLARATGDRERARGVFRSALKFRDRASDRERMYIDAWRPLYDDDTPDDERDRKHKKLLERIVLKYPDDLEAKSLFALANLADPNHAGNELLLQQVLAKDPKHPGAHHYRIHSWNEPAPEVALDSCAVYGSIAPAIGHAQHMPGHIYAQVGMWHEAAIAMDAATRVEKQYMKQRMSFPFNQWNYAHNLNYLSYIEEQLGMANAAVRNARQLLDAPRDPQSNKQDGGLITTAGQGRISLVRTLVKFERWKDLLDEKQFAWSDHAADRMARHYAEAMAHLNLGNLEKAAKSAAAHAAVKDDFKKADLEWMSKDHEAQAFELKGVRALKIGTDPLNALALLGQAARLEAEVQRQQNDPAFYPGVVYNRLGRAYLDLKSPALAVRAYEQALDLVHNDGFALAGLVEAHAALAEVDKARDVMARLLHVWSDADPGLPALERAKSIKLAGGPMTPRDASPKPQRNFARTSLEHLGPNVWEPYPVPKLDAVDPKGARVSLDQFKGKNVLLIFYLGEECPHCLEQLVEAGKQKDEFARLDTEVLAISPNSPKQNGASLKTGSLPFRLLSDERRENARRFQSYDDFEDIELHSTILIDRNGRVAWARHGGDPFTDFKFLFEEIRRINSRPEGGL